MMDERYRRELERVRMGDAFRQELVETLSGAETPVKRCAKRRVLRPALIAAAVAALLVTAAMAAGLFGGWEAFFGKVPDNVTTPVGVSATSGDYTIALEETIVDEDGAAFLLSLKRTDGGVLEGKPGTHDMWLDIVNEGIDMDFSSQEPICSEDGKTSYHCFQFKNNNAEVDTLVGRQLALSYQGIIDSEWDEKNRALRLETVSLAPLAPVIPQAEVNFPIYADMLDPDFVAAVELMDAAIVPGAVPLSMGGGEAGSLVGGVLSKDGKALALALCWPDTQYREGDYLTRGASIIDLIDTRTGERLDIIDDASWGSNDRHVDFFEVDRPLTLEDLPYLEAEIEYDTVKLLSDEPFTLTFTVENTGYIREVTVDRDLSISMRRYPRCDLHVTGVQVSALKVSVLFDKVEWVDKDPMDYIENKLICDDGIEIPLKGEHPNESKGTMTFFPDDWNALIDPAKVVAVQLGDTRIDLK